MHSHMLAHKHTHITSRLKMTMPTLINEDQSGLKPGRYIRDNTQQIYDFIFLLHKEKRPGVLLHIDFEKKCLILQIGNICLNYLDPLDLETVYAVRDCT